MFNELIKEYNDKDYVYVVDGCLDLYISMIKPESNLGPCPVCGKHEWLVAEGEVDILRGFKSLSEYDEYTEKNEVKTKKIKYNK